MIYDLLFNSESRNPAVDEAFSAAMLNFRGVTLDEDWNPQPIPGKKQRRVFLAFGRKASVKEGHAVEELIPPNNILLNALDGFGVVAYADDVYTARKLTTGTPDEPSLTWAAAQALGADLREEERLSPRWLNFAGPPRDTESVQTATRYPAYTSSEVLAGQVGAKRFENKIVIIGGQPGIVGEALGQDLFATPFHRFKMGKKMHYMSGVEVQANMLENLLQRNWLIRSKSGSETFFVVVAALLAGILLSLLRPVHATCLALLSVIVLIAAGFLSVQFNSLWFPWTVPAFLQIPVALIWGLGAHFYVERFFRLKIGKAFEGFVSRPMLERLARERYNLELGGETAETAIMFTDLEGFTNLCEKVGDPAVIVNSLNDYFERTTGPIFEDNGVIVRFMGDAIMAVWGAPFPDEDASTHGARAAWKLFLGSRFVVRDQPELTTKTRIGLHFGEVVSGNVGSSQHLEFTTIGDTTNTAARLEGLNKMLGTTVLLSDAIVTRMKKDEFVTRRAGHFIFKGRSTPITVHELLGVHGEFPEVKWLGRYEEALAKLEAGEQEAAERLFHEASALRAEEDEAQKDLSEEERGDGPSRYFVEAIENQLVLEGGVIELKDK